MSIKLMQAVWDADTGLNAAQKMVLLKLADNASDEGVCWPSQTTIARHCELDRSTVNRAIKHLKDLGIISIDETEKGVATCRYCLHLWVLQEVTPPVAGSHTPLLQEVTPHIEPSLESPMNLFERDAREEACGEFAKFINAKTGGLFLQNQAVWLNELGKLRQGNREIKPILIWAISNYHGPVGSPRFFAESVWNKILSAYDNRNRISGRNKPINIQSNISGQDFGEVPED